MPQSLVMLHVHLVFSTKNRERVLADEDRADLHAYMGRILNGAGCISDCLRARTFYDLPNRPATPLHDAHQGGCFIFREGGKM